ncbi:hypothetical protein L227DRAFT_573072 [Lentinus tigrinus ALCF2SS1-6]|uniref:Uncharacterized protein n=1 Tax=Lentinus tigrinus ALCF2SS1-6 TaxID=1328759 RepID=A0A5C2SHH1_9APHY|nr:hypothetical protein L227DRAFT_573072 [Lentinus tigrinus ALCF2SS1-6]
MPSCLLLGIGTLGTLFDALVPSQTARFQATSRTAVPLSTCSVDGTHIRTKKPLPQEAITMQCDSTACEDPMLQHAQRCRTCGLSAALPSVTYQGLPPSITRVCIAICQIIQLSPRRPPRSPGITPEYCRGTRWSHHLDILLVSTRMDGSCLSTGRGDCGLISAVNHPDKGTTAQIS